MTSDQKIKAAQDQLMIHIDQPFEVRYWTSVFGIDEKTLEELVRRVGPRADRIHEYLSKA